jgi:hypothetical protein
VAGTGSHRSGGTTSAWHRARRHLDFRAVVTKKRRRKELARARAQRRAVNRGRRDARRRRIRLAATAVLAGMLLIGLVVWILLHTATANAATGAGAAGSPQVHYHGLPGNHPAMPDVEEAR